MKSFPSIFVIIASSLPSKDLHFEEFFIGIGFDFMPPYCAGSRRKAPRNFSLEFSACKCSNIAYLVTFFKS